MKPKLYFLALVWLACSSGSALAGRPLQTEDAGVLDRGACEFEAAAQRLRQGGASDSDSALQVGCGIGANTQLALALARSGAAGGSERGLAINGKTSLWRAAGEAVPALVLAYSVAAARVPGGGWDHAGMLLQLVHSRPLGEALTLHANLGHERDQRAREGRTRWGLALEHAGFGSLAPMAELTGDDRQAPWWNLGLRLTLAPEKVFVDAAYGRQVVGQRPALASVGLKLAF